MSISFQQLVNYPNKTTDSAVVISNQCHVQLLMVICFSLSLLSLLAFIPARGWVWVGGCVCIVDGTLLSAFRRLIVGKTAYPMTQPWGKLIMMW